MAPVDQIPPSGDDGVAGNMARDALKSFISALVSSVFAWLVKKISERKKK